MPGLQPGDTTGGSGNHQDKWVFTRKVGHGPHISPAEIGSLYQILGYLQQQNAGI